MQKLKPGDYVLATKWSDGDPGDQWCIGFYYGMTWHGRFLVIDNDGNQFRHNGFRRIEKISKARGEFILSHIKTINDGFRRSLWWWKRVTMRGFSI